MRSISPAAQRGNYNQGGQTLQVSVDGTAVGTGIAPAVEARILPYGSATFTVTAGTHTIAITGVNPQGGDNTGAGRQCIGAIGIDRAARRPRLWAS